MEAGLNLYSLHKLIKEPEEYREVCRKVKEMGYSYAQYSGRPLEPELIRDVQDETGLTIVLTHVPMERILDDTQKLMEDHAVFGCRNIGLGGLSRSILLDESQLLKTLERLNEAGRVMAENGFKFFYHNHNSEFFKMPNGQCVLDYMIENCPKINFTADTYWIQYGGGDVQAYLKKMAGRIGCIHLKDYCTVMGEDNRFRPQFAPVGEGNLDFTAIVPVAKASGTEYFLVEQDDAGDYEDPMAQVRSSIDYIRSVL